MSKNTFAIDQTLQEYRVELEISKSANTARSYVSLISRFLSYLDTIIVEVPITIEMFKSEYFRNFLTELSKYNYSKATLQLYISALNHYRNWLVEKNYIPSILDTNEELLETEKELIRGMQVTKTFNKEIKFSNVTLDKVKEGIINPIESERNYALLCLISSTRCLPHEICDLRIKDFDMGNRFAIVFPGNLKEHTLHFDKKTASALQQYWYHRGWQDLDDPAFARHDKGAGRKHKTLSTRSFQNIIRNFGEIAEFKNRLTARQLRVNGYKQSLENEIDLSVAERILSVDAFKTNNVYLPPQNLKAIKSEEII